MALEMNITWNGRQVSQQVARGAVRGLNQAAAFLQGKAVPRTPKDTGELRNSLTIHPASTSTPFSAVTSNLVYATRQHEELGYRHKYGEAKFLERPMYEHRDELQAIIANNMNRG